VALVLAAALAAAYAPKSSRFGIIYGAHRLEQTIYFIVAGLLVLIFFLSHYFRLSLDRPLFGIALGLGISACVHLATWAIIANGGLADSTRSLLDFVGMATYHVCVLIWWYYLLVPANARDKKENPPQGPLAGPPVEDLEVWNEEMERLLHR
jgi:Ca2+/Na+ antiporter